VQFERQQSFNDETLNAAPNAIEKLRRVITPQGSSSKLGWMSRQQDQARGQQTAL